MLLQPYLCNFHGTMSINAVSFNTRIQCMHVCVWLDFTYLGITIPVRTGFMGKLQEDRIWGMLAAIPFIKSVFFIPTWKPKPSDVHSCN